jgi:hypothetical protein
MSEAKNKLIKIAYENPELRGDLLPIISGLEKEAAGGVMQRLKELFTSTKNAPKPHIFTSKDLGLALKDKEIEKFNHSFNVAVKGEVKNIKLEVLNKLKREFVDIMFFDVELDELGSRVVLNDK